MASKTIGFYDLNFKHTGLAIMINNYTFKNIDSLDKDIAQKNINHFMTLKEFGFDIKNIYENQSKAEMVNIIKDLKDMDYSNYGCLFLCIFSVHGRDNKIYCKDYSPENDEIDEEDEEKNKLDVIMDILEPLSRSKTLRDKPKILLLHFDRGEGESIVNSDEEEAEDRSFKKSGTIGKGPKPKPNKDFSNFLIGHSTFPSYKAYLDPEVGSIFFWAFFDVLRKHGQREDIDTLKKYVVEHLKAEYSYTCANFEENLTKKFSFVKL